MQNDQEGTNAREVGEPRMKLFTTADGPRLQAEGRRAIKKPNPVFLERQEEAFSVQTNEGVLKGQAGDSVAHDPISGHVWPVSASYVEQHYDFGPFGNIS
jgi:hypothetical protein